MVHKAHLVVLNEVADDDVRSISITSRDCKFPEETEGLWAFKRYSYTACLAQCFTEMKMKLCNCTDRLVGYSTGNTKIVFERVVTSFVFEGFQNYIFSLCI